MTEQELIAEIRSWCGTPWMHMQAVKGVGADCIQLVVAVAKRAGWMPADFKTVKYSMDYALHNTDSVLIRELARYTGQIPFRDMSVGDVLVFKFGKCGSHAGICIGPGRMVHSHIRHGVIESDIAPMRPRLLSVWRFPRG